MESGLHSTGHIWFIKNDTMESCQHACQGAIEQLQSLLHSGQLATNLDSNISKSREGAMAPQRYTVYSIYYHTSKHMIKVKHWQARDSFVTHLDRFGASERALALVFGCSLFSHELRHRRHDHIDGSNGYCSSFSRIIIRSNDRSWRTAVTQVMTYELTGWSPRPCLCNTHTPVRRPTATPAPTGPIFPPVNTPGHHHRSNALWRQTEPQ